MKVVGVGGGWGRAVPKWGQSRLSAFPQRSPGKAPIGSAHVPTVVPFLNPAPPTPPNVMIDLEHGGVLCAHTYVAFPEPIPPSERRPSPPPEQAEPDGTDPDVDNWVPDFNIERMPTHSATMNSLFIENFFLRKPKQMRLATLTIIRAMAQLGMQIRITNLVRLIRPAKKIARFWREFRERKKRRIAELVNYWCCREAGTHFGQRLVRPEDGSTRLPIWLVIGRPVTKVCNAT